MVGWEKRERIRVELPPGAPARQRRELTAFVRYCVQRIEKDLGARERWAVRITHSSALQVMSTAEVHDVGLRLETTGTGSDGELAIWDAMCRLEQLLLERGDGIKA